MSLLVQFVAAQPGLLVVSYAIADDLLPERQTALIAELEKCVARGATAIVFEVGPTIRGVDVKVPSFWLDVTARLSITAIAIVTQSTLVRVAANGFSLANVARGLATKVSVFPTLAEAKTWAADQLKA